MSKALAFFAVAASLGTGYVLGKRFIEKNPEAVAAVKENCSEKLHKASVYCAGAIKTGSEKLSESVSAIVAAGKEKSGELVNKAKSTGASFKNEINNLKDMVVSINNLNKKSISIYALLEYLEEIFKRENNIMGNKEKEIFEVPEQGSEAL